MGNTWSFLPAWLRGQPDEEEGIEYDQEDDKTAGVEAATPQEAVALGHKTWQEAYDRKDFTAICKLYTRDCKICPSGTRTAFGRPECAMGWESLVNTGITKIMFTDTVIESSSNDGMSESSGYRLFQGEKEIDQGKHVMIWKKINNKWFIHIHIFSSLNPREKTPMVLVSEACMRWELAYYTRDLPNIGAMYTEKCVLCPPAWPQVEGQLPVERFWARFPSMGVDHMERVPMSAEEMGPGHLMAELRYTMFDYRNAVIDLGKSIVVFKLSEDNRWCIHTEIFNSDASLPSVSTENEKEPAASDVKDIGVTEA